MTLAEIAQLANVSKATVSRVLSNSRSVSPKNAEKVYRVIRSTGLKTQNMATPRTINICAMITGEDIFASYSPLRWKMLKGIQSVLDKAGANLIIKQIDNDTVLSKGLIETLDGVILIGRNSPKKIIKQTSNLISVWVNSQSSNDRDGALAKNQMIGEMAAKYLISKGHKKMAFFDILYEDIGLETDKYYFEFLVTKSDRSFCSINGNFVPAADDIATWQSFEIAIRKMVKEYASIKERPTGLFIPVGHALPIIYSELKKYNIIPGKDVDIIGCGGYSAIIANLNPIPVIIDILPEAIGQKAAEQLLWRIYNPEEIVFANVAVIPQLIENRERE